MRADVICALHAPCGGASAIMAKEEEKADGIVRQGCGNLRRRHQPGLSRASPRKRGLVTKARIKQACRSKGVCMSTRYHRATSNESNDNMLSKYRGKAFIELDEGIIVSSIIIETFACDIGAA